MSKMCWESAGVIANSAELRNTSGRQFSRLPSHIHNLFTQTMTNTRAGAASLAVRAKEKLSKLLLVHRRHDGTPETTNAFKSIMSFSYDDLRRLYLQRLQDLHPDTQGQRAASNVSSNIVSKRNSHAEFVELQEAWENFTSVRVAGSSRGKCGSDGTFTRFGVGCSFSDNESEREQRNKIMDQACRGWFARGELATDTSTRQPTQGRSSISLLSNEDEMFQDRTTTTVAHEKSSRASKRSLVGMVVQRDNR